MGLYLNFLLRRTPVSEEVMHINEHGIEIVKNFEGISLKPYLCPANVWTVGYGATVGKRRQTY